MNRADLGHRSRCLGKHRPSVDDMGRRCRQHEGHFENAKAIAAIEAGLAEVHKEVFNVRVDIANLRTEMIREAFTNREDIRAIGHRVRALEENAEKQEHRRRTWQRAMKRSSLPAA